MLKMGYFEDQWDAKWCDKARKTLERVVSRPHSLFLLVGANSSASMTSTTQSTDPHLKLPILPLLRPRQVSGTCASQTAVIYICFLPRLARQGRFLC